MISSKQKWFIEKLGKEVKQLGFKDIMTHTFWWSSGFDSSSMTSAIR